MGLVRIVMHWSAGGHKANASDKKHYHEIVEGDGTRVEGEMLPEANISTGDGHYAAHVRRLNTGSIGLSMASMSGARSHPFSAGRYPITQEQLNVFTEVVAEYCDTYSIEITRETVLTHAEVQPTLGVAQSGKWDITWLPGMDRPGDPIDVGDRLRSMVLQKQRELMTTDSRRHTNGAGSFDSSELAQEIAIAVARHFEHRAR